VTATANERVQACTRLLRLAASRHPHILATGDLRSCRLATSRPAHPRNQPHRSASTRIPRIFLRPRPTTASASGNAKESTRWKGNAKCAGEPLKDPADRSTCPLHSMAARLAAICAMPDLPACLASRLEALANPIPLRFRLVGVQRRATPAVRLLSAAVSVNRAQTFHLPPWDPKARPATRLTAQDTTIPDPVPSLLRLTPAACCHPQVAHQSACELRSRTHPTTRLCPNAS
jgi:hypothetical protein